MKRDSVIFYEDWMEMLYALPSEFFEEMTRAILDYGIKGERHDYSPMVGVAMKLIIPNIDRNNNKYSRQAQRNRENGEKGGRPPKSQSEEQNPLENPKPSGFTTKTQNPVGLQQKPKTQTDDNDNVIDKVKDKDKDINLDAKASSSSEDDAELADCLVWKEERLDIPKFIIFWNKTVEGSVIPAIKLIVGKRRDNLNARFKQYGKHDLFKAVTKLGQSEFLKGNLSDKGWHATFDWFLGPRNFAKVLEGNYDNQQQGGLYGNGHSNNSGAIQGGQQQRLTEYANVMGELLEQGKREATGGDNGREGQVHAGLLPGQADGDLQ